MLVTRQFETGRNTWSSSKLEAIYQNTASPRMSNFEPLPPQPDWREQYSAFSLSGESGVLQPSFGQHSSSDSVGKNRELQPTTRPTLEHRHSLGPLRKDHEPVPAIERPDSAPPVGDSTVSNSTAPRDDSLVSPKSTTLSLGSNPLSSVPNAPTQQGATTNKEGEAEGDIKEEDDDLDDDDDMLDAETEEGAPAQTAEQRRAERRKMKRFR